MSNQTAGGNSLGWKFFFALLVFCLGNGTNYLIFGLHNVTAVDFDRAQQTTNAKLDAQNDEIDALKSEVSSLVIELRVRKEIGVTR